MTRSTTIQGLLFAVVFAASLAAGPGLLAREADTITITPSDFNIPKSEALERLGELETMAAISVSTADYARAFRDFQDDLSKVRPPISEWAASEKERVENLKQPSEAAWKALGLEEDQTRARLQERSREAEADWERRQAQQREQQLLGAEQARTEQQLRLQDAQIRESEARSDYYEELTDDGWNTWYNPWWYSRYPGSPIHRRRHNIEDGYINNRRHNGGYININDSHRSRPAPDGPRSPNNYNPRPSRR